MVPALIIPEALPVCHPWRGSFASLGVVLDFLIIISLAVRLYIFLCGFAPFAVRLYIFLRGLAALAVKLYPLLRGFAPLAVRLLSW